MAASPEENSLPSDGDTNDDEGDDNGLDPIPEVWKDWLSCFLEWLDNQNDDDDKLEGTAPPIPPSSDSEDIDEGDDEYLRHMWKGFWDFYLDEQKNKDDTQIHETFDKQPPSVEPVDDNDRADTEDPGPLENSLPVGRPEWEDFWDWFNRQKVSEGSSIMRDAGQSTPPPSSTSSNNRGIGSDLMREDLNRAAEHDTSEDTTCIRSTTTYTVYPDWFRE